MVSRRRFIGYGFGSLVGLHLDSGSLFGDTGVWSPLLLGQADSELERRREYLALLQRVLRPSAPPGEGREGRINGSADSWEEWVEQSGELPPDFSQMPSQPLLPDPLQDLTGLKGGPIETLQDWDRQKAWIREEYQKWVIGRLPPAPDNLEAEIIETRPHGEATIHEVVLRFGPEMQGTLRIDIHVPKGRGPFPAFVTPQNRGTDWVRIPFRRGYVVCIVKAADPIRHQGDDSDAWIELYPDYDFSGLARWAWAVMRAVDHLVTLPYVNSDQIATGGNSRYAKSTLIAAAFDERIGAALPSRGNCGCGIPWRFATGMFVNESLEELTRLNRFWFHPRLRFFTGREDRLPVDQNLLVSLVAPRGLLLSHAFTEHQGNPWAIERSYRSAKRVYEFLGAGEKLGLIQRPGEHTVAGPVLEFYMDFCDGIFGRAPLREHHDLINGFEFQQWEDAQERSASSIPAPPLQRRSWLQDLESGVPWATIKTRSRRRIQWLLGETPPALRRPLDNWVNFRSGTSRRRSIVYPRTLFQRPIRSRVMGVATLNFGDRLQGDLYLASKREDGFPKWYRDLPTVIWLHPYAYAIGYSRYSQWAFEQLTARRFGVIGLDLIGSGTRVEAIKGFYDRYPDHSLLGRMVTDLRALITAIHGLREVKNDSIYVVGSGLGAKAALFHAAMDDRVRGVAAVSGFGSLRDPDASESTEGLSHYTDLHGLLPRLARYEDRPEDIPVDYDEVLAMIAPRPTLVIAPEQDRYHRVDSVRALVDRSRSAFAFHKVPEKLTLETPEGFNGFETERDRQLRVFDWLLEQEGRE